MYKANIVGNAIRPSCGKMSNVETVVCVDNARTIDDNKLRKVEGKVDIVVREKKTYANNKMYYKMHLNKNKIPIIPDKIKKITILSSF